MPTSASGTTGDAVASLSILLARRGPTEAALGHLQVVRSRLQDNRVASRAVVAYVRVMQGVGCGWGWRWCATNAGCAVLLAGANVHAEGSLQTGDRQHLLATTPLYVNVLAAGETVTWTGVGTAEIQSIGGTTSYGVLNSGENLALPDAVEYPTDYQVVLSSDQLFDWDITVMAAGEPRSGRLCSTAWHFDAGSYAQDASTDGSFYVLVPDEQYQHRAVVELKFDGLAGFNYTISANSWGVDGGDWRRSVPQEGETVTPQYPVFLNVPAIADLVATMPNVSALHFSGGPQDCTQISPAGSGEFGFAVDTIGTFHLLCDFNSDGEFAAIGGGELIRSGDVASGGVSGLSWNGLDGYGDPVELGTYSCIAKVHTGEVHFVAQDIETSYEGFRMFDVRSNGTHGPLRMFWDDTLVQDNAILMPNGDTSTDTSGPDGLLSGDYSNPTVAPHGINISGSARAWGAFQEGGKGNAAFLDTYTYVVEASSGLVEIEVVDGTVDSDDDGVPDLEESCQLGTNPELGDTDGDSIGDAVDSDPLDPLVCADSDGDTCDDCSQGVGASPANDGPDADADGLCDAGDPVTGGGGAGGHAGGSGAGGLPSGGEAGVAGAGGVSSGGALGVAGAGGVHDRPGGAGGGAGAFSSQAGSTAEDAGAGGEVAAAGTAGRGGSAGESAGVGGAEVLVGGTGGDAVGVGGTGGSGEAGGSFGAGGVGTAGQAGGGGAAGRTGGAGVAGRGGHAGAAGATVFVGTGGLAAAGASGASVGSSMGGADPGASTGGDAADLAGAGHAGADGGAVSAESSGADDSGGCGCRSVPHPSPSPAPWVTALMALIALRRKRSRPASPRTVLSAGCRER